MAEKILVLGETGCGKSTSTKTLDPKSTFFINVIGKPLPFKGWKGSYKEFNQSNQQGNMVKTHNHEQIIKTMQFVSENRPEIKTIVVDDAQYVMSYEFMERARERGFDKFTEIAQHMFEVFLCPDALRDDLVVVFLAHSEDVNANGYTKTKIKTIGKMLDEKITVEGMFTVVLLCSVYKLESKLQYFFVTRNDGTTTVKTPEGMFDKPMIPNDLKLVLDTMNQYYEGE
jgi:broad-specificity NMP kinase